MAVPGATVPASAASCWRAHRLADKPAPQAPLCCSCARGSGAAPARRSSECDEAEGYQAERRWLADSDRCATDYPG